MLSTISKLYRTNFQSQLVNKLPVETHMFLTEDGKPQVDYPTYQTSGYSVLLSYFQH